MFELDATMISQVLINLLKMQGIRLKVGEIKAILQK